MPAKPPDPPPRSRSTPSGASEIAPGVFVGGWDDALRFEGARICVRDEAEDDMPAEAHHRVYDREQDVPDRAGLEVVVRLAKSARAQGKPVLLFCGHGIRRGPLAGAWYLHRVEGLSLEEAYARIRGVRPKVEHVKEWVGSWEGLAR